MYGAPDFLLYKNGYCIYKLGKLIVLYDIESKKNAFSWLSLVRPNCFGGTTVANITCNTVWGILNIINNKHITKCNER